MRDVSEHYGQMLHRIGQQYGTNSETYTSLNCAMLNFASRFKVYAEHTVTGSLELLARLGSHYRSTVDQFGQGWSIDHIKVYLDVSFLLCTLYAQTGRMEDAVRTACELNWLTSRPEVTVEVRHLVNTYLVSLELLLLDMESTADSQRIKTKRLGFAYSAEVEREFVSQEI